MSSINNNFPVKSSQDIGRYSTDAIRQLGAKRKVITANGRRKNFFDSRKGGEKFYSPENVILNDNRVKIESYPEVKFFVVKAYFQKRGSSDSNAETLAMLIFDIARLEKVDPLVLLESLPSGKVGLSDIAYLSMNVLRPVDSQHQKVSDVNNRKSLKAKNILA